MQKMLHKWLSLFKKSLMILLFPQHHPSPIQFLWNDLGPENLVLPS